MNRFCGFLAGLMFILAVPVFAQATDPLPGQIAYIGTDHNVYSRTLAQDAAIALTNDAGVSSTGALFYQWPTWANDGQLAYFGSQLNPDGSLSTEVLISPDG